MDNISFYYTGVMGNTFNTGEDDATGLAGKVVCP
jgi:hypothetical protein